MAPALSEPPGQQGHGKRKLPGWFWWALAGGGAAIVLLVIAMRSSGGSGVTTTSPSADTTGSGSTDLSGVSNTLSAGFAQLLSQNQQLVQQETGFETSLQQQLSDLKTQLQQQQSSGAGFQGQIGPQPQGYNAPGVQYFGGTSPTNQLGFIPWGAWFNITGPAVQGAPQLNQPGGVSSTTWYPINFEGQQGWINQIAISGYQGTPPSPPPSLSPRPGG